MDRILKEVQSTPGFRDLVKSAGADGSDEATKKQFEETWKMLDNLAKNDPAKYKKFVDEQMKDAKSDADRSRKATEIDVVPHFSLVCHCIGTKSVIDVAPGRHATPADLVAGQVLHINVCSHEHLLNPVLPGEAQRTAARPTDIPYPTLLNLQVDMALSPARAIEGSASGCGWAVDVVISPWVAQAAAPSTRFHPELCSFLASVVADELGIVLSSPVRAQALYSGGREAGGGQQPHPFKLAWMQQQKPDGNGAARGQAAAAAAATPLSSPAGLLGAVVKARGWGGGSHDADGVAVGLEGLCGIGKRAAPVPASTTGDTLRKTATEAEQLASAISQTFPLEAQLYGAAAAVEVSETEAAVVALIRLQPAAVHIAGVKVADVQLDVDPEQLCLRLPRPVLPLYRGLDVSHVVVALLRLPCGVDPERVAAKWSRKEGTLRVEMHKS